MDKEPHDCTTPLQCQMAGCCLFGYVEAPPQSWDDLVKRQAFNTKMSGFFIETTTHMPCPACGAKDFMLIKIMSTEEQYNDGAVCKECERGFRMPVKRDPGMLRFSFEQTVGPDLPPWFKIAIPRSMAGN